MTPTETRQLKEWLSQWKGRWKSIDKDNMEFQITTTYSVVDLLDKFGAEPDQSEETDKALDNKDWQIKQLEEEVQDLRAECRELEGTIRDIQYDYNHLLEQNDRN